jgi:hypothetical protein
MRRLYEFVNDDVSAAVSRLPRADPKRRRKALAARLARTGIPRDHE